MKEQREAKKKGKSRLCRSFGPWAASPAPFLEQSLQVLPSRSHQCFTIHTPESSEAKAPHAMPVFAFCKQGFDPDTALAYGLLIWLHCMVGTDPLQVLLIKAASEGSPVLTRRAVLFEGAGIAGGSICPILLLPFRVVVLF